MIIYYTNFISIYVYEKVPKDLVVLTRISPSFARVSGAMSRFPVCSVIPMNSCTIISIIFSGNIDDIAQSPLIAVK